jgi:hypothetical protein
VDKSLALIEGVHSKNLATFNGAKEQCYSYVEGTVQQAKSLLDPTPYLSKLAALADPDKIVDTSFQYLDPVAGKVAPYGEQGSPSIRDGTASHITLAPSPRFASRCCSTAFFAQCPSLWSRPASRRTPPCMTPSW